MVDEMFLTVALNLYEGRLLAKKIEPNPRITVIRTRTMISSSRMKPLRTLSPVVHLNDLYVITEDE